MIRRAVMLALEPFVPEPERRAALAECAAMAAIRSAGSAGEGAGAAVVDIRAARRRE